MLPSWVSSWCYQQMLDQTGKFLPGANTLAYWASLSAMKKVFFNIDTYRGELQPWEGLKTDDSDIHSAEQITALKVL